MQTRAYVPASKRPEAVRDVAASHSARMAGAEPKDEWSACGGCPASARRRSSFAAVTSSVKEFGCGIRQTSSPALLPLLFKKVNATRPALILSEVSDTVQSEPV